MKHRNIGFRAKSIRASGTNTLAQALLVLAVAAPARAATLGVPVPYNTIQAAIAAAVAGDTISVAAGTYTEIGQVEISKDLSIVGADKATTVIKPAQDTGTIDDAKGWFLVDDGVIFNMQNLTLDGSGRQVFQAIRHKGSGIIAECAFTGIQYEASGPAYQGTAIGVHSSGQVDVTNCSFSGIGRNGVAVYDTYASVPTPPTGTYSGNTYVGKGLGNWLDYAFLIQSGAAVILQNNQISDCVGVATFDGSGSSGVAVWDDPGTKATLTGNAFTNNSVGLALAIFSGDSADPQVDVGAGNTFTGGEVGVAFQNVGLVAAAAPAVTFAASTFKGQTGYAIQFDNGIGAGITYDINSIQFKDPTNSLIVDNTAKEDLVYDLIDAPNRGLLVWDRNVDSSSFVLNRMLLKTAKSATKSNGRFVLRAFLNDNDTGGGLTAALLAGTSSIEVADAASFDATVSLTGCSLFGNDGSVRCHSADKNLRAIFDRLVKLGPNIYLMSVTATQLSQTETGAAIPTEPVTTVFTQEGSGRTDSITDCKRLGSSLQCRK